MKQIELYFILQNIGTFIGLSAIAMLIIYYIIEFIKYRFHKGDK